MTAPGGQKLSCLPWLQALAVLVLLGWPWLFPQAELHLLVLGLALFYGALALAWNIFALSGLLSLGHGAFFGLGAYAAVLLERHCQWPVYAAIIAGGMAGALYGGLWFLGFGRLRRAYFALATLAALEIPRVVADNWESVTGGSMGIVGLPRLPALTLGSWTFPVGESLRGQYYFLCGWLLMVLALHWLALRSRWGWALRALREDETAAAVLGVNVAACRFAALSLSALLTGVCGGIYAYLMGLLEPGIVFSLQLSAMPLILSFFGGRFTTWGPLLGALLLYPLDQLWLQPWLPQGHAFIYGLVIVLTVYFFPKGITAWPRRRLPSC